MPLFKKVKKQQYTSPEKSKKLIKVKDRKITEEKIKKKTKIGFRHRNKKQKEIAAQQKKEFKDIKKDMQTPPVEIKPKTKETEDIKSEEVDVLPEFSQEEIKEDNNKKEKQWAPKKKKLLTTDLKGKPVYLEDTGEKLGTVFDMIYDGEKKLVGYKIKDEKTESILSFPADQFDQEKDGLIFVQSWYTNAIKILEKLEFKERVSPELTTLIGDETIPEDELYDIFVKHDDQMANYIDEAISLKELLNQRLKVLEKQRLSLKESLMDLTEKRLIKDIDRREFSENIMNHRRKVNVLDVNINKCKDLLKRLDATSFGRLGKNIIADSIIENKSQYLKKSQINKSDSKLVLTDDIENPYKQKYIDIKERFNQLQEDYNELKLAVEKMISKGEI